MTALFVRIGWMLGLCTLETALPAILPWDAVRPLLSIPLLIHVILRCGPLEGAALAGFAGFVCDAVNGTTTGLSSFSFILLFLLGRAVMSGVAGEGPVLATVGSAALALSHHILTYGVMRILGPLEPLEVDLLWRIVGSSIATAVVGATCADFIDRSIPRSSH